MKQLRSLAILAGGIGGAIAAAGPASAAIPLTTTPYGQNFDSLPSHSTAAGSTFTWTDNSTLSGWYAKANGDVFRTEDGSTTTGGIYSHGAASSAERALGGLAGPHYWGARFQNKTGTTITGFSLSYTGEQWRDDNTADQALKFDYLVTDANIAIDSTGWTAGPSALDFTSPQSTDPVTKAIDGNLAANKSLRSASVSGLTIAPNSHFWVRWFDANHTGDDHALAIDDLTLTAAVPEPGMFGLVAVGGLLALRRRHRCE
jgi:MYXO-CTERM domain-containing protein